MWKRFPSPAASFYMRRVLPLLFELPLAKWGRGWSSAVIYCKRHIRLFGLWTISGESKELQDQKRGLGGLVQCRVGWLAGLILDSAYRGMREGAIEWLFQGRYVS